ncbi:hypothetical protein CAPTEDRAFT_103765 [Capitella teleta]|uniref:Tyrosine specific protein phosphatases domain-containing protein n=1 Tax=Capitella teleta TaxID=283909 RepID=R7U1G9_CAPTE|nr:hypothetical protein CAPTEDRAFT_103765 [Capitella teleta]|eukprot:ELT97506.1 hypothetical protein CAPTEDRAFT_103765 [Capitella teleta]
MAQRYIDLSTEVDDQKAHLVRTNEVAPIIIRNCREEFQHVSEFKEPIVYGRIAENMPEHALIQNQFFMVKDVVPADIDRLGTYQQYLAPNLRKMNGPYPVYGMGQPTKDGLSNFMSHLREENFKTILLFNLREEPVLFVQDEFDMIPYSPRHQDTPDNCIVNKGFRVSETARMEVDMRREIIDLAAFKDDQRFYFYDDIENFKEDPHMFRAAYEDDLGVSEEIYSRLTFNNSGIRYLRLCLPSEGVPMETDIDAFVTAFIELAALPVASSHSVADLTWTTSFICIAHIYTLKCGQLERSIIVLAGAKTPYPINDKSPNFDRAEFAAIQQLVHYLPEGLHIKRQVDVIIDQCGELHNMRTAILESKKNLESITEDYIIEGKSAKQHFLQRCVHDLQRYFYAICFNAYLHQEFRSLFGITFTTWMQSQPDLYNILRNLNISERRTSPDLLIRGDRFLVADDYLGLDVLSSQMDVKTSNFRRVPGLPVYGMAQPSREGLSCVANHLLSKKQGHPLVVIFNLRDDLVIECNGATYGVREADFLDEPIVMPGITGSEISEREEQLKKAIKAKKNFQVRHVDQPVEAREFNSVLTVTDMVDQLKLQTKEVMYHRIPMWDDSAPAEKHFDQIMQIINGLDEVNTDEDGPALVFQCRTGKGRTTTAMAIAGLIISHKKGFPYGTKPGEEERVSLPNAKYTQGHYKVVQDVVRRIPDGQQVKREVDFILNQCSDTMTPMHYHMREIIFVTYNKMKKSKTSAEQTFQKKRSLDYLERYIYLILFNTYLHCERRTKWSSSFTSWMTNVAAKAGMYEILDNLAFLDFEPSACQLRTRRARWNIHSMVTLPTRGHFV